MSLNVVKYGEPVLRQKGARIEQITPEIKEFIDQMLDTMYKARGLGLASQQVGRALQLTVIDIREATGRPSTLEIDGKESDPAGFMPLVLINPEIKPVGEPIPGPEGCLSFPEVYCDITRPESIDVKARNENWHLLSFRCGGLLARAIQHEYDHLQGILFIDRMTREQKMEFRPELDLIQAETKAALAGKKPKKNS
ncbi:MAG: def [Verrucomicrobiales bacterium]|nr:def [Verrucomicrobiales bacterium]